MRIKTWDSNKKLLPFCFKLWVFVHWEEGYMFFHPFMSWLCDFFQSIYELVMWLFIHRQEGYGVTFKPLQCTLSAWAHQLPWIAPVFRRLNYSWSPPWSHSLPSPKSSLVRISMLWLDVRSWVTTHTFNLCFIRDLVGTRYHAGVSLAKWLHNPYMLKWRFHNCSLWMKRGRLDSHKLWLWCRATWWRSVSFIKLKYWVAVISLAVTGKTLPWCCWLLNKTVQS